FYQYMRVIFDFCNSTRTTEIYTLSLHDALPICYGIQRIEVSTNDGASWQMAQLDPELGKYSWRRWRLPWLPAASGKHRLRVRALDRKSTRLNSSHQIISYAVFCLKKKKVDLQNR